MSIGRLHYYVLLATGFFLLLASAVTAYYEIRPFFVSGPSIEEKVAALTVGELVPGPSELSRRTALDDCYRSIRSLPARASPPAAWERLLDRCAALAAEMTGASPANAYAWFIGAVVAAETSDIEAVNSGLRFSRATSPNESWLAQLRVELAEAHLQVLDAPTREAYHADLALLVSSNRGLPGLVARYVGEPEFRNRMSPILEQLPGPAQRRFIDAVRRSRGSP